MPQELQQEQPQLYENLTKILNPEEQQIVQAVIVQADANAVAAQAIAAATAAQTNGGSEFYFLSVYRVCDCCACYAVLGNLGARGRSYMSVF